ncbi:MAG: hypothetical protein A2286_06465 [Gammaproteobacteria bacterium RIFOXYA12_FULL_61_12]|nr:MAG: hypothetical protein A2286_06465 [Gammaproteobacteria bacterium RIFOXYA12_FULL_61_12]
MGADGLHGKDPAFLRALEGDGECFLIDIHSATSGCTWKTRSRRYRSARPALQDRAQFKDAKGQVGMGHCQARGWKSWHHHMAMVAMAMLSCWKSGYDGRRRIRC